MRGKWLPLAMALCAMAVMPSVGAAAPPPLWVAPANDASEEEHRLFTEIPPSARAQLTWQVGLPLQTTPSEGGATPETLLKTGIQFFYDLEIERGVATLEKGLHLLQTAPHRIHTEKLARDTLAAGLLTLARAHLEEDREGDASRVITWLMRAMPDLVASPRKHPGFLVKLVQSTQKRLAASRVDLPWEGVGTRKACSLRIQGMERSGANPIGLTPGSHVIQLLCDGQEGWVRQVILTEGKPAQPMRSAVHAEAAIHHSAEGHLRWKRPITGLERLTLTRDLAKMRGMRIVTVIPGEAGEGPGLVQVDPDGTSRTWNPRPPVGTGTGRVWTWVSLGVSAALGVGAGAVNAMHNTHIQESAFPPSGDDLTTADGLKTTSLALYGVAGAAAITAAILFFLEAPPDVDVSTHGTFPAVWNDRGSVGIPSPTGLPVSLQE